jgi:hypothetical protein
LLKFPNNLVNVHPLILAPQDQRFRVQSQPPHAPLCCSYRLGNRYLLRVRRLLLASIFLAQCSFGTAADIVSG